MQLPKELKYQYVYNSTTGLWEKMAQPVQDGGDLNVDVTGNTIGLATAAKQLADGHNVTVDNVTASPVPVQVTDGTDNADVVTNADDDTDLDGQNGLVVGSVLYGRIDADTIKPLRIDAATHSIQQLTYEHHEIHSGSSFTAHFDSLTANADDARSAIGFTTPNTTKWPHPTIRVNVSASAEAFLEEAPTIDDDAGTQQTIYNRNRNSATTSTLLSLEGTPTANEITSFTEAQIAAANYSAGTILDHVFVGSTTGPKAIGGETRADEEWVLKQNTKYLIRLQNVGAPGAAGNQHELHMDWYEHTDKD